MADQTELRMNLAAVKKADPYAKDIVDSSAHVAFYTFNSDENEWEKTDVEGVFFIYSRNAEPLHSIFINNRLNTNPFIEPITGQLELQAQSPFLLYRNERSRIRGFWFYNNSECDRIGELVARLIKECETTKLTNNELITASKINSNDINIFTMLSKAQEDFNNLQNRPKIASNNHSIINNNLLSSSSVMTINNQQPDVTSQSVMNFFAAAKPAAASEVPLFQRLMSKPVPVDQIEKQQRATTPQDGKISPPSSSSILQHNLINLGQQQHTQGICNNTVSGLESALNLMGLNSSSKLNQNQDLGTSPLAKFLGTSSILPVVVQQPQQQQKQQQQQPHQLRTLSASEIENSQKQQQPLQQLLRKESIGQLTNLSSSLTTASKKPALMPPTMFLSKSSSLSTTASKDLITSSIQTNCLQRQQSVNNSTNSIDGGGGGGIASGNGINLILSSPISYPSTATIATVATASLSSAIGGDGGGGVGFNLSSRPEPLTQTQLTQAILYLIQHDPDFIKKLHEAYLKSFTEMVSL